MSCYKKNIDILHKQFPEIKNEILDKYSANEELVVETSRTGLPTAKYSGIYLHSKHDPVREAARLVRNNFPDNISCCIFYGFGFGYQIEAFIDSYPDTPLIILEPDIPLFLKALETRDLSRIFSSKSISIALDTPVDSIIPLIDKYKNGKLHIFKLRSLIDINEKYFKTADEVFSSFISRKEINSNTLKRFGHLWIRNLIHNLPLLYKSRGVSEIENLFQNIPSLLIAAGPSLDRIMPKMEELQKRFLIIAVDTALSACKYFNVEPDFIVIVDPQYWNTRHLDRCFFKKSIIISESSTHPGVFRHFKNPAYFCSSLFPLGQYLEKEIWSGGKLGAGGSVATTGWDFARFSGSSRIFCGGLDLGFPEKSTHYKDSFFEKLSNIKSYRFKPSETFSFSAVNSADPFLMDNNDGTKTTTDRRLVMYRWWFENQIKIQKNIKTFNLSRYGIKIEGMEYQPLKKLLKRPVIREKIDKLFSGLYKKPIPESNKKILKKNIDFLLSELKNITDLTNTGILEVDRISGNMGNKMIVEKSLKKLDEIDKAISTLKSCNIAGFLLHNTVQTILENNEKGLNFSNILETSKKLYLELHKSSGYHKKLLESAIKKNIL